MIEEVITAEFVTCDAAGVAWLKIPPARRCTGFRIETLAKLCCALFH
jgi:hypothetical protein